MPQHKSSIKRVRQDKKKRIHNRALRSKMRTLYKKVFLTEDPEKAEAALKEAVSYIDRMAVKGILHKNNAANKKSNIVRYVNALSK
ncbi:SSU ribosomal protein S20P [Cyclonatronum proteinivorum]|uniref:Small ribosomal subunit protein bS20 n=1 Tax=Cyclonatronum proteinivorum TaxID=1457365 RepID=A0A345UN78_9BACT|nr:30S ribosomal protein S20 [Cyclonatronum proteinivorum]AXJ01930.1 SSU ribosomal protein S20P [Cyclonatronum proteinivorum]